MKLFILFILINLTAFSQDANQIFAPSPNQIYWKVEGKYVDIVQKIFVEKQKKIVLLSTINGDAYLNFYDYINNEMSDNIKLGDLSTFCVTQKYGVFITQQTEDEKSKVINYDYEGNIINEFIPDDYLMNVYQYSESEAFVFKWTSTQSYLVKYDIINKEIIEEYKQYGYSGLGIFNEIDNNIFISCQSDNLRKKIVYDIDKSEFVNETGSIFRNILSYQVLDNKIVTFNIEGDHTKKLNNIIIWDRETLEIIEDFSLGSNDTYFDFVDLENKIYKILTTESEVKIYDYKNIEDIETLESNFSYSYLTRLTDNLYMGYNAGIYPNISIYNEKFENIYGPVGLLDNEFHSMSINCVEILPNKILTGSDDKTVRAWDYSGVLLGTEYESEFRIYDIKYSEKHNLIFLTEGYTTKTTLKVFDTDWNLQFEKEYKGNASFIEVDDEFDKFAISGRNIPIEIYNISQFELLNSINIDTGTLDYNTFSVDFVTENQIVYSYKSNLIVYDFINNNIVYEKQDFIVDFDEKIQMVKYDKINQKYFVSLNLPVLIEISSDFTKTNHVNTMFIDSKDRFVDASALDVINIPQTNDKYYLRFNKQVSIYDNTLKSNIFEYSDLNMDEGKVTSMYYNDIAVEEDLVVVVNRYAEIYSLVPYKNILSVEKEVENNLVFPNPTFNELNINTDYYDNLIIFNSNGIVVKHIRNFQENISTNELPAGTYYVKLKTGKNEKFGKFVKLK